MVSPPTDEIPFYHIELGIVLLTKYSLRFETTSGERKDGLVNSTGSLTQPTQPYLSLRWVPAHTRQHSPDSSRSTPSTAATTTTAPTPTTPPTTTTSTDRVETRTDVSSEMGNGVVQTMIWRRFLVTEGAVDCVQLDALACAEAFGTRGSLFPISLFLSFVYAANGSAPDPTSGARFHPSSIGAWSGVSLLYTNSVARVATPAVPIFVVNNYICYPSGFSQGGPRASTQASPGCFFTATSFHR